MIEEIWIENNGYKISNTGLVTKRNSNELQKMSIDRFGYVKCNFTFDDGFKAGSVHRAVAYAFLKDTYKKGLEVNHIDGNKLNNNVDNLEWVTKKENQQHEARVLKQRDGENCYRSQLSENEVIEIYNLAKDDKYTSKELAKMYNTTPANIGRILNRKTWKHLDLPPINRKDKPIIGINVDTGEEKVYDSVRFAKKDGFTPTSIIRCCKGESKTGIHMGYRWSYNTIN